MNVNEVGEGGFCTWGKLMGVIDKRRLLRLHDGVLHDGSRTWELGFDNVRLNGFGERMG